MTTLLGFDQALEKGKENKREMGGWRGDAVQEKATDETATA